jgi:hypothetical protein
MAKLTIPAKVWSKPVQEYKDRFGHGPSAEACKFRTDAEISAMAEEALKANTAIDAWKFRPFRKYGTGLDELYHSDPPNHHEKSSSGEFAPLSKKKARKQAIEATIKSNKLAKKKRAIEKTSSERVETTRKSDSKNLTVPTSAEDKIYIDSVRARSVASDSIRFDINNKKAATLPWRYVSNTLKHKPNLTENEESGHEISGDIADFFLKYFLGTPLLGVALAFVLIILFDYELPTPEPFFSMKTLFVLFIYGFFAKVLIFIGVEVIYEELREWIVTNKRNLEAVFFMLVQVGLAALGIMALLFVLTAGGGGNSDYGYYDDVDEYPIRR